MAVPTSSLNTPNSPTPSIHVDVCIVSYRTADMVIACLRTLFAERQLAATAGIDVRILVVDNQSGDADPLDAFVAAEGVQSFAKIIRAEKNGGFAYGNNVAFRYAYDSGRAPDYFWLLNPDTQVRPGALIALVDFMKSRPKVGIAGSALYTEDGTYWPYAFRFPTPVTELHDGLHLGILTKLFPNHVVLRKMGDTPEEVDWLPGASMLLRREVVDRLGGMDEAYFLYYEETDYCRRLREAGFSTYYVPQSMVMHIAGGSTGVTSKRDTPRRPPGYWYDSRRRYFQKNFGLPLAVAADALFIGAAAFGHMKEVLKGKSDQIIPHQIRDVFAHSPAWKKNRDLTPVQNFRPTGSPPR